MNWKDEYATGVDKIDQDHRMIFKISEDFRSALNAGLGDKVYAVMLDNITVYCRGHLSYVEHCMEEHRSSVGHIDKAAHKQFLQALSGFKQRYAENGYDALDAHKLVDTIDLWLARLICDIHPEKSLNS